MSRRLVMVALSAAAALIAATPQVAIAAKSPLRTATVKSFDGTPIHVNFFTAVGLRKGHRAPTVMMGPGWSSPGDTSPTDGTSTSGGSVGVGTLRRAGFNVLTWDPRGFGVSGGTVHVDNPKYEGRDVSALISWLAKQPQAQLDSKGDPRVGMAGGSYGGGIQLVSAAIDHRIDAIVPDIAWHSLVTSLYKNQTGKLGWATLLYDAALIAKGRLDPLIGASYATEQAGNPLTAAELHFYASSGPGALVKKIKAPTLLIQGTVDDLFTLQEAVDNYSILRADGVPVKMLWFCGGHGICLTKPGDTALIQHDTIAWLDHYLKGRTRVRTGPVFQWVDQHGVEHTGGDYPLASAGTLSASGSGTLQVNATGGAGPVIPGSGAGALGSFAANVAPALASNAVDLKFAAPHSSKLVVGAPTLTLKYSGLSTNGRTSTSIYAQVIDDSSQLVLGNQITPIPVTLDGATHTLTLPLEILAATDRPGESFTLQLTPSTVAYQTQLALGTIDFSQIKIALPLVNPSAKPPKHRVPNPAG
jgi:ABC-2 type transport system ATP-binding protein